MHSQIDVLNKDYARLNADSSNTPLVFRPLAAHTLFRFELAKVDSLDTVPQGLFANIPVLLVLPLMIASNFPAWVEMTPGTGTNT